jgi:ssDNA-binding replication factor A large subunit
MLYTVRGLTKDVRGASIRVRVITKNEPRKVKTKDTKNEPRKVKTKDGEEHRVVDVHVGDRTGRILLTLWDEKIEQVQDGDLIDIENGYVTSFKGRYRLNIGRYGSLECVEDDEFPTREDLLKGIRWKEK